MRVLVCGWFSFEPMGATAGDLQARDVACRWLEEAGVDHDVALAPVFAAGLDWRSADPGRYSHLLFVCGPFDPDRDPVAGLLARFAGARLVGLDVSVARPLDEQDPFHLLFARDSSRGGAPDLAFAAEHVRIPAVGVILVPRQREYGERARHTEAEALIDRVVSTRPVARVDLDTALTNDPYTREGSLRSPAEVESLVARVDAVVTTRLHGLVLALKVGVPVVAVDPVAGGAKVLRQAREIGWPHVRAADDADDAWLGAALDACLGPGARDDARACAGNAAGELERVRERFVAALRVEAG
ncbi:MAG: polysaccharide pyruvyl transferase family protein [Thermoleophilaceae bacterium]